MPYISLEYTNNICAVVNYAPLFDELHKLVHRVADANIENCKSSARTLDCYYMGTGDSKNAFVHLDLGLLAGRSAEVKKELGEEVLKLLARYYSQSFAELNLQITVKIVDIEREEHFKL